MACFFHPPKVACEQEETDRGGNDIRLPQPPQWSSKLLLLGEDDEAGHPFLIF